MLIQADARQMSGDTVQIAGHASQSQSRLIRLGRRGVGTDLNPAYHQLAKERTAQRGIPFVADDGAHP